ncbi:MAG TPA: HipA family kinase [Bryobacteraceae bacterium]|nr:HipA family kinase [Bryobacteraceae bacterium]
MPINATRLIRKMRGGAQAHLFECDDGHFYVVKFRNNPQHRRVLVNEWISSVFLRHLQIAAPEAAIVNLSPEFLEATPEASIQLGSRMVRPEPGWHFGSQYPGDPLRMAVYDFLPDVLLGKVANAAEFPGVFAFDKWTSNADSPQAIFFRARLRQAANGELRPGFLAQTVDHGYVFDGPHWSFEDSPLRGLYFRPLVYERVRSWDDFQPWLERIEHFPEEVIDDALRRLPPDWVGEDAAALGRLMHQLLRRRKRVSDLIREAAEGKSNPFPNWRVT